MYSMRTQRTFVCTQTRLASCRLIGNSMSLCKLSKNTFRRILRHVRNRTNQTFRVIDISDVPQGPLEQMGTKDKFWLNWNGELWLFKNGRPNTGEHWAEKLAEVIGYTLGIPVAEVELA